MTKDFSFGIIPFYRSPQHLEFLLVQHQAGHWAFPKGHPENGESPLQTAQREFEEETGVTLYQVDEETTFSEEYYPQKDGQILHKTVTYYPAEVGDKKVVMQEEEIQAYAWLSCKEALKKITFAPSRKILKEVRKYLESEVI